MPAGTILRWLSAAALVCGCGEDSPALRDAARLDASSVDAAPFDAGTDTGTDGGGRPDAAPADAATDGPSDAATDGPSDAATDGPAADAGAADPCAGIEPGIPEDRSRWASYSEREYTPLEPRASHANVSVRRGMYKTARTVPLLPGDAGQILFEDTAYYDIAVKLVSLSECPGDFGGGGSTLPASCVRMSNASGIMAFYYRTPSARQEYGCTIEPGRTYYLNVVHATDPEDLAGSNTCVRASECGFNIDTFEAPR